MIKKRFHISRLIAFEILGSISEEQLRQLNEWKAEDASNVAEYLMIQEAIGEGLLHGQGQQMDTEEEWHRFLAEKVEPAHGGASLPNVRNRRIISLKFVAAAVVLLASSILLYLLINNSVAPPDLYTVIAAPLGSTSHVILPDASEVWLNAGSRITYSNNFNSGNRKIKLDGEAFFDVKKGSVPFLVITSDISIRVMGTRFNVKAYPDDMAIETTLESGKLIIEKRNQVGTQFDDIVLHPNQKATFFRKEDVVSLSQIDKKIDVHADSEVDILHQKVISKIVVQKKNDLGPEIGWKDGEIIVEDESLELLARKLERRYQVKFVFRDQDLRDYKYSGRLKDLTLEQVLHALKLTSPIQFRIDEKEVTLWVDSTEKSKYNQLINKY